MSPLIFFAVVIVIDLILKSVKDKKRIEKARQNKIQELRKEENIETAKPTETRVKREIQKNPSLSKHLEKDRFLGEGKSYREDHKGYSDRYANIGMEYDDIKGSYKDTESNGQSQSLYDRNAIQRSDKKEYDKEDIRNYGKDNVNVDIPMPTASTIKSDVLNGIIFSEILGKPKGMQKRDI